MISPVPGLNALGMLRRRRFKSCRGRPATLLVVGVLLALLAPNGTLVVADASTVARPGGGAQFHGMWSDYDAGTRTVVLDRLAAAGVRSIRMDLGWASLEPNAPGNISQWYVDRANAVINAARARGMTVLVTLFGSPSWANGGKGNRYAPDNPADFGRITRWLATHFRGRVEAWEVWNEPNHPDFWNKDPEYGATDPADPDGLWKYWAARYVELLRAAYPQFKAGDPNAKVVLGAPVFNDWGWIWELYARGAKPYFDVMATNAYMAPADAPPETPDSGVTRGWTISAVLRVHEVMARYADTGKEIWFTEVGWSSHSNTGSEPNWRKGVTEQQQADYYVRTMRYIACTHPYVKRVFWYREKTGALPATPSPDGGDLHRANFGLLRSNLTPKPVYDAMRSLLTGAPTVSCP